MNTNFLNGIKFLKNTRCKIVFLFSVISILITNLSALICSRSIPDFYGLIVGVSFTIIALIIHLFARKKSPLLFIVSICLNALGTGFSIGCYYSYRNLDLPIRTTLICLPCFFVLSYLTCLIAEKQKKYGLLMYSIPLTILGVATIHYWKENSIFSYGCFTLIILAFFIILCQRTAKTDRNVLQESSIFSFGIYIIVTVIVLAILTDGDSLDFVDFWSNDGTGHKKHANKIS